MEEQEIDLRDHIKVILKRKKVILAVFFVTVITTAIVSFLMPKVYEVTSTVQIGSVDDLLMRKGQIGNIDGLLMGKEEAKEILLSQNLLAPIIKGANFDIELEQLKEIKIEDIKNTNFLKIKVQCSDPEMAVKINKAIANVFISRGQGIYQKRLFLINERLKELETEIKDTEGNIRRTQNLITELHGPTAISQQDISLTMILLQNTLPNYESHVYILKNRRNELKISLSTAEDFKIVETPIKPKYPIKPKKRQNIALSGILGLMLAIFIAFSQEFWSKSS